jgi:hypothetical protein
MHQTTPTTPHGCQWHTVNGHTVYGVPSVTDGPRPLTRRDLRRLHEPDSWLSWAWLTLRLRLRGDL